MKQFVLSLGGTLLLAFTGIAQAIESLSFDVLETYDGVEIRQYATVSLMRPAPRLFARCSTTSAATIAATQKSP